MNQFVAEKLNGLMSTLDDLVKVYRHLLETVRRERDILISANLDDLNENNRTKEAALIKVAELEEARVSLAEELSIELGLSSQSPRLLEMARQIGGPVGDRLTNIHSVLELLLQRVQDLNRSNEVLVKSALENITGAMKSIRDSLQEKPTYERRGEVKANPAGSGQLVSREA